MRPARLLAAPAAALAARSQAPVRLALIGAFFLLAASVLVWRLFEFQLRDTGRYQRLALEERQAEIPIIPRRGALLDVNGHPLAVSVLYDSVYALGTLVGDPDRTATILSPILDLPAQQIRAKLDPANGRPVVLKSRVPSAVGEEVRTLTLPGVYLEREPIRQYPEGSLAAQVLGFVGQDFTGLAGLELSYDTELAGTPGVIETEKDTSNQEIALGRRVLRPPREGADLVLTLDRFVQRTAERLLREAVAKNNARGGLILVMEPATGSIVASATLPTYSLTDDEIFDPSQPALYKSTIATDQFEPGSTMKTVTMASAIEEGLVSPGTLFNDTGVANVAGTIIRNWDGAANGTISMTGVLIKSSNVGTQHVAGLLGADRFYRYVEAFGFGKRTGVRLPGEVEGSVRARGMEGWTRVDLATNSYGQGIAVTPLQMLSAVASFANGGVVMRPRLVREVRGPEGPAPVPPVPAGQPISAATARALVQMMTEVANQEALRDQRIPGYQIALKTGTADTPTNLGYDTGTTFASVTALLPAEDPKLAVLVRLDGPEALYGGRTAAPVLSQLAEVLFTYYRIPPSDPAARRASRPPSGR